MRVMSSGKKSKKSKDFRKSPSGFLNEGEVRILEKQIQANSLIIGRYIEVIDLLVNKERCPKDANTLLRLRTRLAVAIAENDTFRRVLWRHAQLTEASAPTDGDREATAFLVSRIKLRKQALIAQAAMKSNR